MRETGEIDDGNGQTTTETGARSYTVQHSNPERPASDSSRFHLDSERLKPPTHALVSREPTTIVRITVVAGRTQTT